MSRPGVGSVRIMRAGQPGPVKASPAGDLRSALTGPVGSGERLLWPIMRCPRTAHRGVWISRAETYDLAWNAMSRAPKVTVGGR